MWLPHVARCFTTYFGQTLITNCHQVSLAVSGLPKAGPLYCDVFACLGDVGHVGHVGSAW